MTQRIPKELRRDIVCIFEEIYVIIIYHHIAANKKKNVHHVNIVCKPPRALTIYFLSRNIL